MVKIHVASLNQEVKKKILNHAYSTQEMHKLQEQMKNILENKKKGMRRAVGICFAVVIFTVVLLISKTGWTKAVFFSISSMLMILFLIFSLVWYLQIGKMRLEYNRAVMKGYPKSAGEYLI